jgi:UrcA family protein
MGFVEANVGSAEQHNHCAGRRAKKNAHLPAAGERNKQKETEMTSKFTIAALAFAGFAAALSAPASAEQANTARVVAVRYSDLDLASDNGQRALERRIDIAAREVCGVNEVVTGTRFVASSARTCYAETLGNLTREVAARSDRTTQRG